MPMNATALAAAINAALQSNLLAEPQRGFALVDKEGNETNLAYMCEAIADAVANEVVKHIQTFAEATSQVTVTVDPGIAVATAGSPSAQTGATTGPGSGHGAGVISAGSIR